MDKLTTKSQEAIASAMRAAATAGNPQLEPVHVLVALLEQPGGVAPALVDAVGANRAAIVQRAQAPGAALPGASGASPAQPAPSRAPTTVFTPARAAANRAAIVQRAQAAVAALPGASGASVAQPAPSRAMMTVITQAGEEANGLGDQYVSTEHLLMAIARSESTAGQILRDLGADRDA